MWSLYKRGPVWWATQTIDGVRERRSTGCTDKVAAGTVVRRWEREDADPRHRAENTTTLGDALSDLIDDRRVHGRADGTLSMYTQKAAHVLRVFGERARLVHVTAASVDDFCARRLEEGASRSTISKELTTLRAALRLARRRGRFSVEVSEVMPVGWSSDYTPRTTFLTPEQVLALLVEVARDTSSRATDLSDRAGHVAFLVATAARWSESLRARPADVDTVEWVVRLRGTKTERSNAVVPVAPGPARTLLEFAVEQMPETGFRPWGSVTRDLANACARAKVPRVTPNDLRRTAATWLVQRGVSLHAVSKVLRHVDTRMVERVYGQLPTADLRRMLSASVPVVCPSAAESGEPGPPGETESAYFSCPGAESNRRHADFQSNTLRPVCRVIGEVRAVVVTVVCLSGPEVRTFGELLDLALGGPS